jgi:DNA mismatch endonuclease (patch repair protein)
MTPGLPPLPAPPLPSSPGARAVMQGNRSSDTGPELAVRSALHRRGLRFRKNTRPIASIGCRADVVFSRARVAVFVDGCFWHGCPDHGFTPTTNTAYWAAKLERTVMRDRRNDAALAAAGWTVVRVWEHELAADAVARIEAVVRAAARSGRRRDPSSTAALQHSLRAPASAGGRGLAASQRPRPL